MVHDYLIPFFILLAVVFGVNLLLLPVYIYIRRNKMHLYILTDQESKAVYFTSKDSQVCEDWKIAFKERGKDLKIIKLVQE